MGFLKRLTLYGCLSVPLNMQVTLIPHKSLVTSFNATNIVPRFTKDYDHDCSRAFFLSADADHQVPWHGKDAHALTAA